ncbi:hypothetical protein EON67_09860 [archaeon]|nr:MAG: hypothetical protein EON67_09860 [archaeon]
MRVGDGHGTKEGPPCSTTQADLTVRWPPPPPPPPPPAACTSPPFMLTWCTSFLCTHTCSRTHAAMIVSRRNSDCERW